MELKIQLYKQGLGQKGMKHLMHYMRNIYAESWAYRRCTKAISPSKRQTCWTFPTRKYSTKSDIKIRNQETAELLQLQRKRTFFQIVKTLTIQVKYIFRKDCVQSLEGSILWMNASQMQEMVITEYPTCHNEFEVNENWLVWKIKFLFF